MHTIGSKLPTWGFEFFFTSAEPNLFFLRILGKVSAVLFSHFTAEENVHIPKRKDWTQGTTGTEYKI